jgi:phage shock protein PspC (stress-responsive transcriptional regulator)
MISGVASGLAEYFDVDPTLVRLVFVIAALINGIGIFVYIVMSFIVPSGEAEPVRENVAGEEPVDMTNTPRDEIQAPTEPSPTGAQEERHFGEWRHREQRHTWAGLILIALGVLFLAQNMGLLWWWNWRLFWPAVLIGVGALLLTRQLRR